MLFGVMGLESVAWLKTKSKNRIYVPFKTQTAANQLKLDLVTLDVLMTLVVKSA